MTVIEDERIKQGMNKIICGDCLHEATGVNLVTHKGIHFESREFWVSLNHNL